MIALLMRARASIDQASGSGNIAAVGAAERRLRAGMTRLYAVAENKKPADPDHGARGIHARAAARREVLDRLPGQVQTPAAWPRVRARPCGSGF